MIVRALQALSCTQSESHFASLYQGRSMMAQITPRSMATEQMFSSQSEQAWADLRALICCAGGT
jgi:hypothetical protein